MDKRVRFRSFIVAILALTVGLGNGFAAFAQKKTTTTTKKTSTTAKSATAQKTATKPAAPATPYAKGYTSGYSDGFGQGGQDWRAKYPRDYKNSDAYQRRERLYDPQLADSDEYRQGYDLGYELGYTDGYFGRLRNAEVPVNGEAIARAAAPRETERPREPEPTQPVQPAQPQTRRDTSSSRNAMSVNIPVDTKLRLQLTSEISTKTARVGDRFTATVTSPDTYANAVVEGHVSSINKSGRVSGKTEMSLTFDSISLEDGRKGPLTADIERIVESDSVKTIDEEGNIQSGSRTSDSQKRGGIGAAAGAVIGGIAGGIKGAILGAVLGGGAGVATVAIEGSKDLVLGVGTEMVIRTAKSSSRAQ
ncbi:MAG: hypothetical protein AB1757_04700 [Acidobacteriota bacterium]